MSQRLDHDCTLPLSDQRASRELEDTRWQSMDAVCSMRDVISGLRARGYEARAKALDDICEQWARACRAPLESNNQARGDGQPSGEPRE